MKIYIFESKTFNPYANLALERYFTLHAEPESCLLFLWQNDNTVVIGKNQNHNAECNITAMLADDVKLARRLSGGGAVYHDLGNVNFSFIAPKNIYSIERQLNVILNAVNSLGLSASAQKSGRNDLIISGAKFSGNAFINEKNCCHHGTILVNSDFGRLAKYLNVNQKKLASKGVQSVRSRVVNLSELGNVCINDVKKALYAAFEKEYGSKAQVLDVRNVKTAKDENFFSSKDWIMSNVRTMQYSITERFNWGTAQIGFDVQGDRVSGVEIFTDSLDENLAQAAQQVFEGRQFKKLLDGVLRQEFADIGALMLKLIKE